MISSPSPAAYKAVLMTPPKSHLQLWVVADGLSCRERTQGQDGMGGRGSGHHPCSAAAARAARAFIIPQGKTLGAPQNRLPTHFNKPKKKKKVCLLHATQRAKILQAPSTQRHGEGRGGEGERQGGRKIASGQTRCGFFRTHCDALL